MRSAALIATMALAWGCAAAQRDLDLAEVHVYKEQLADRTRYTFVVTNNGDAPITGLEIGYDYYVGEPILEGPQPLRIGAPAGWSSRTINMEESAQYSIGWDIETSAMAIKPGQMRVGFVIETALDQPELAVTMWTVKIDGSIPAASDSVVQVEGPLPNVDTLPPLIHLTASPAKLWPPNGAFRSIHVDVDVSDDTDSNPQVQLVSVTCGNCESTDIYEADVGTDDRNFQVRAKRLGKDKLGRIYKAVYRATDAAGNYAEEAVEILVPHDQR